MKYLKIFELLADYEAYKSSSEYVTPNVSYIESESGLLYDPFVPSIDINNYCTFVALEDGFSAGLYNANYEGTLEYCIDGNEEWAVLEANTDTVAVNAGQTISFKGNLVNLNTEEGIGAFVTTKNFNVVGNVMSLLFGDNAATSYSLEGYNNIFKYLFSYDSLGNKNLISVSKNFLPATALADFCYFYMFRSCSNLTTAPELPATTLCEGCYDQMFLYCSSLTTVPELPATTLADFCYTGMFSGCSSLTTVPELPATALASYCYSGMFSGCSSLTTVPELPATTLAGNCYYSMFRYCNKLTAAPELPATTLAHSCYASMFNGCTALTVAPELPATTLAAGCYMLMFDGCTSLTAAPELPATTLAINCYNNMFDGCTSLTAAPELPATTLADSCYQYMFLGCTSLTAAPELPATTLASYCYSGMFKNCYSLTTAPELPATTLASYCYSGMFSGCTNLNYIKMLATDVSANAALSNWVENVASTGTFVKLANTKLPTGTSGIPAGWTVVNDGDSNGDSNDDLNYLFGNYTESFNDASYYGYPAKGTLNIEKSDKSEYDLKMTFFGGKPCAVTTYGTLSNNGTQITTVQTSCNMGTFSPSTFNVDTKNGVVISGAPKFSYPSSVPDYVATKN